MEKADEYDRRPRTRKAQKGKRKWEIKTGIKKEKEWKTVKKLRTLRDRKTKQPEKKRQNFCGWRKQAASPALYSNVPGDVEQETLSDSCNLRTQRPLPVHRILTNQLAGSICK